MAFPQEASIGHAYRASLQTSALPIVDDSEGTANGTSSGVAMSSDGQWYELGSDTANILSPVDSPTGSFSQLIRVKRRLGADWLTTTHNFISVASGSTFATLLYYDGTIRHFQRNLQSTTSYDISGWVVDEVHTILVRWNSVTGTLEIFVDDPDTPVFTRASMTAPTNASPLIWGAYVASNGWGNDISDMVPWDAWLSDAEVVQAFAEVTPADSITGTGSTTLDDAAGTGSGSLAIVGTSSTALDDAIGSGAGSLSIVGASTITLDGAVTVGTGSLALSGSGSTTLGDAVTVGTGSLTPVIIGTGSTILDDAATAGTGSLSIAGTGSITLDDAVTVGGNIQHQIAPSRRTITPIAENRTLTPATENRTIYA